MNYEEIKLESELDAALDNWPDATNSDELAALLKAARMFKSAREREAANASLARLLKKLPAPKYNPIFLFLTNRYMAMSKFTARRTLGTILAVLCLAIGLATGAGRTVKFPSAWLEPNLRPLSKEIQSGSSGVPSDSSALGVATGLGIGPSRLERVKSAIGEMIAPDRPYPPDYYGENDIRDTREYLKMSYYASIKTRHPDTLAERAQISIRGLGGRLDSSSISPENSYLSFVLPKANVSALREEVKMLAGARFVTENVSAQNLLPQKKQLEQDTESTATRLKEVEKARAELTRRHAAYVRELNQVIAKDNETVAALDAEAQTTADSARLAAIASEKAELLKDLRLEQQRLAHENRVYQDQLTQANSEIKNLNDQLDNLAKEDTHLAASVETVSGSLSFSHINYWGVVDIYLGGYLAALSWVVVGLAILYLVRRPSVAVESV